MESEPKRNGGGVLGELLGHEKSLVELRTTALSDVVGGRGRVDGELVDDARDGVGDENAPQRKALRGRERGERERSSGCREGPGE